MPSFPKCDVEDGAGFNKSCLIIYEKINKRTHDFTVI